MFNFVFSVRKGTNLDEKDADEKGFEWINTNHPRMYATAAVAEQNSLNCPVPYNPYTVTVNKDVPLNSCLKQQQHHTFTSPATMMPQKHQTFITANYNTMIPPHSKYSHVHKVNVIRKKLNAIFSHKFLVINCAWVQCNACFMFIKENMSYRSSGPPIFHFIPHAVELI